MRPRSRHQGSPLAGAASVGRFTVSGERKKFIDDLRMKAEAERTGDQPYGAVVEDEIVASA
jgi:hypothetical protein